GTTVSSGGKIWRQLTFSKLTGTDFGDITDVPTNATVVNAPISPFYGEMINVTSATINGVPISLDRVEFRYNTYPIAGSTSFNVLFNIDGTWNSTMGLAGSFFIRF